MTEMVTISIRIPKQKRERMRELGISPTKVIRKAIDEAIRENDRERLIKEMNEAGKILRKVSKEEWVKAIRESRDER